MNTIEEQLAHELQQEAHDLPAASGDLQRVRLVGRRWLIASRVASITAVAAIAVLAVAGSVALHGKPSEGVAAGGRIVFENGYALTPTETASLLVECLRDRGLDVTQSSSAIEYDNRIVTDGEFEAAVSVCGAELRGAGFLLPGDNPDHLQVLYAQYVALAECYREAGIQVSDAPTLDDFIDARQAGIPTWSPQGEAIRRSGIDAADQAERGCAIPTPQQFQSGN